MLITKKTVNFNLNKTLIILPAIFIINCFAPDLVFCHKCLNIMASIKVVDAETNQFISNPEVEIVCLNRKNIPTRTVNQGMFGDSINIQFEGQPGIYSFYIRKKGYREIKIEKIKIKHYGYFRCDQPETLHMLLRMYNINYHSINEQQDNFIEKYHEGCCK